MNAEPAAPESPPSSHHRFAYMLVTHREPAQVEALARRILDLSPLAEVVVHHDLEGDGLPWDGQPPERVHLVERRRVVWGDWSIVDATLRMIEFSASKLDADWFVVLSGEHWPVVDLATWEGSVGAGKADALVEARELPPRLRFGHSEDRPNRFLARCVLRWTGFAEPGGAAGRRLLDGLARISGSTQPLAAFDYAHRRGTWLVGLPRRRGPLRGWTFYKGSQWMAFNRRAADSILQTDPAVAKWYRHSHIPDESYFHTLLYRDTSLTARRARVTFVPSRPGQSNERRWMLLNHDDLPDVRASGAAFARKVDLVNRPSVVRAIDAEVDRRRGDGSSASTAEALGVPAGRSNGALLRADRELCVAVLGMHRSGTSATAGLVIGQGAAGPHPDDLVPPSSSNERGHWESLTVVNINTRLLASIGATTYSPPAEPPDWLGSDFTELRHEATRWFADAWDGRPIVLKDPRVCVTFPFWRAAIPAAMAGVLVVRDPDYVARSLHSRDNIQILLGLAMWDRYLRTVVQSLEGLPTLVLDYDAMLADPSGASAAVSGFFEELGVRAEGPMEPDGAADRIDPSLRHQRTQDSPYRDVASSQRTLYSMLSAQAGYHPAWRPPALEPAPPWVEDTLRLRRELESARRELRWVQASRAYRVAGALWRRTGQRPSGLTGSNGNGSKRVAR